MEKLADREAEIRELTSENSELESKLNHQQQQNSEHKSKLNELEGAYDELIERFNEQEEELRVAYRSNEDLLADHHQLKIICTKLERAVDTREEELSATENELGEMHNRLSRSRRGGNEGRSLHRGEAAAELLG